jgi:hypothetical protein
MQPYGKTIIVKQMTEKQNMNEVKDKTHGKAMKPWQNENAKIQQTPFGNWDSTAKNKSYKDSKIVTHNAKSSYNDNPASINVCKHFSPPLELFQPLTTKIHY